MIKNMFHRSVEDIIAIGHEALRVKNFLSHGDFMPWCEREFGEGRDRTINNCMRAAVWSDSQSKFANFANLDPSILYLISAKSAPSGAVARIVKQIEAGEEVMVKDAQLRADRG